MGYDQLQAHQSLRDYVRCFWKLENNKIDALPYTIFPDGFFDLLICYRNQNLEKVLLTGLWDQKTKAVISPGTTVYGVQFRLLAAEGILQQSIAPLLNGMKELEKSFLGLDKFDGRVDSSLFDYLNQRLLSCIEAHELKDARKAALLKDIDQTKGQNTVEAYSNQVCWSKRQINRYFQSAFGLSLKKYCGIRKGATNYSQIKRGQLYPQQGYFDQSHFIKEIKKITGFTPKALSRNENDRFLQFSIIKDV